ncbi:MAG: MaoC family dehydratase [Hyphomonadaceae bacterium]|nr:MaoC family dehydratase [Hyphomonadaceae bacterium]
MKDQSVQDNLSIRDQTSAQFDTKLHHEDIEIGKPITFGRKVVTTEEILAFGRAFDPQPMHIDEAAAKATPVGGLCASGWHTCGLMMRMLCDGPLGDTASLGSPGIDEVRWTKPVRPGDVLSCRHVVTDKRDLASRPDVGLSKVTLELVDARGKVLAWWHTNQLTRKRHPGRAASLSPGGAKPARSPLVSLWDAPLQPAEPARGLFFEDRQIGEITEFGCHTFDRDEIIAFARAFDPQPFHLDAAAAEASLFGALCASGWHTAAIFIREVVRHRLAGGTAAPRAGERQPAYGPSPGFRDLRWPKPVYVGDTIRFRARLAEKIDLKSRPNRGILASEVQARNQKGEIVFAVVSQILVDRREPYRPA